MRNKAIFFLFFMFLNLHCVLTFAQNNNDSEDNELEDKEIETIVKKVLVPTLKKLALLASQKAYKKSIIVVCKSGSIEITYGEILNLKIPQHKNVKELFVKKLLPGYTKTGEALATVYDKYLMREINQLVDYMEAVPKYGLILIAEHELADVYLAPEKQDNPKDSGNTLEEGLESKGVKKSKIIQRYGDIVGLDLGNFEDILEKYNLEAIAEMTNFYKKFDTEKAKEYASYLEAILEIAEKNINTPIEEEN